MRELLIYVWGVATGLGAAAFFGALGYRLAQQHNREHD